MKRLGPLIISLFVAVTAWAGDVGYTVGYRMTPTDKEYLMVE